MPLPLLTPAPSQNPFNSRSSGRCIIPGDTFEQWYFIVFAFPGLLVLIFALFILGAYGTTKRGAVMDTVRVTMERGKYQAMCENVLKRQELFSLLPPKERHEIATLMPASVYMPGDNIVVKGHRDDSLHVIVDGTCDLKEDGLSIPLNPGECFGSQEQLHGTQHISTITAWPDKCTIATLTGNTFASLRKRFEHVSEFVAMFEQMERERRKQVRREHGGPVDMGAVVLSAEAEGAAGGQASAASSDAEAHQPMSKQLTKAIHETHLAHTYTEKILEEEEEMKVVDDFMVAAFQASHRHVRNGGLSRRNKSGKLLGDGMIVIPKEQRVINHTCSGGLLHKLGGALSRSESVALSNFYTVRPISHASSSPWC